MTIAVIRADPSLMSRHVANFKKNPLCKGQPVAQLAQSLMQMTPLPIVSLDLDASNACKVNTVAKLKKDQDKFELKGNSEAYKIAGGNDLDIKKEDDTVLGWTGSA